MKYNYVMRSTTWDVGLGDSGRFSDPSLFVLACLAEGPLHGHAMLAEIERMGGSRLGPGTLYGAIGRLKEAGWIEPLEMEDRRQPYRLTQAGERILRARLVVLGRVSMEVLRKLTAS